MNLIQELEKEQFDKLAATKVIPEFGPGDTVIVNVKVVEGERTRVQAYEGVCIGRSGGELAAMALIDACVRLLPGVMGKQASGADESFSDGLLEYPQYTRPQDFEGEPVPDILTSGDHARVAAWRQAEAERLTQARRPDLWAAYQNRPKAPK